MPLKKSKKSEKFKKTVIRTALIMNRDTMQFKIIRNSGLKLQKDFKDYILEKYSNYEVFKIWNGFKSQLFCWLFLDNKYPYFSNGIKPEDIQDTFNEEDFYANECPEVTETKKNEQEIITYKVVERYGKSIDDYQTMKGVNHIRHRVYEYEKSMYIISKVNGKVITFIQL